MAEDDDGRCVGMALWYRTFSTWVGRPGIWLEDLFVRPEHRGGGHGRALLDAVRARTDGRVEWAVLDWNQLGHRVLRLARRPTGRRLDPLPLGPASRTVQREPVS